jgi:hypothetical protein
MGIHGLGGADASRPRLPRRPTSELYKDSSLRPRNGANERIHSNTY